MTPTTIAFTLCSNNYLAMAKTLGESVLAQHPDWTFVTGLVDHPESAIDYSAFPGLVIPVEELGIGGFDRMQLNYNIIELNTSVKPFYFQHLFKTNPSADVVVYLDPDTYVYNRLDAVLPAGGTDLIVLTPHISQPIPLDGLYPDENLVLNHGIYNLGFLALHRSGDADQLLTWWAERMVDHCKIDLVNGFFTDQLYMNLAPLFFNGVRIEKHPGVNLAFWNLHQNRLSFHGQQIRVNETFPLIHYHFSGFVMDGGEKVSKGSTRFRISDNPVLVKLFADYREKLIANGWSTYRAFTPWYVINRNRHAEAQYQAKLSKYPVLRVVHWIKKLIPTTLLNRLLSRFRYSNYA
ncbi:MAG: glycosyl transferase [Bacteroidetes bacterium]|nr:glycosyl transferase [Bacteroidota bacterium]